MSRYPAPELKDLPEDIRARILEVQEKSGFIPNVFLSLARRPAEWRAFFAYHDALMLREESNLTKGEREMIVTTTPASTSSRHMMVRMKNAEVWKFFSSRNSIRQTMKTSIDTAWLAMVEEPVEVDFRISTKKKHIDRMIRMSPDVTRQEPNTAMPFVGSASEIAMAETPLPTPPSTRVAAS